MYAALIQQFLDEGSTMFRRVIVAAVILTQVALLADVAQARCRLRRARRRVCYKKVEYRVETRESCTVDCKCTPDQGLSHRIAANAPTCKEAHDIVKSLCNGTLSDCHESKSIIKVYVPVNQRPVTWQVTYTCQTREGGKVVASTRLPGYRNAVNAAWALAQQLAADQGGISGCSGVAWPIK